MSLKEQKALFVILEAHFGGCFGKRARKYFIHEQMKIESLCLKTAIFIMKEIREILHNIILIIKKFIYVDF